MKLEKLRQLCCDMHKNNVTKTQFEFKINQVTFDVAFFINKSTYQLIFGPIITPSSAYSDLCAALNLKSNPKNPFSTKKFFEEFASKIPEQIQRKNSSSIPKLTQSITDPNDFGIFSNWKVHTTQNVSKENLLKTQKAFGLEVMAFCESQNVSSCWKPTK